MKTLLLVLIFIPALSAAQIVSIQEKGFQHQLGNIALVEKPFEALADSIAPDSTGMDTVTSVELAQKMVPGWNIGNSLDAVGGETAWGNPLITQKLIDSVKAAGFRSIRIPVAWSSHFSDTSTYMINPTWMARVEEVVNYVLNDSMYAIINEHWDGGWQQPSHADSAYVNSRLASMWEQIAVQFRDYDDHVLFAGTNEIHYDDNYGGPTAENAAVQNSFNQTFVTTVRSTGGRNEYRYLLVQGYNTNIDNTISAFVIPADVTPNRLMVEVHYYDPSDFTINSKSSITEWGMYATVPSRTETGANEAWADGQFQKMKTTYIDHGYAVVLGEYGAIARTNLGNALNDDYAWFRRYYTEYITRSLERHGLAPFYWDDGGTGNGSMGVFNRSTGAQAYPDIIQAVVDTNWVVTGVRDTKSAPEPTGFLLEQNFPNPFNPSTKITFDLPSKSYVSLKVYDVTGREVADIAAGEMPAGSYTRAWDASRFSSGVYLYRLQAGQSTETKKLVLIR